MEVFRQDQVAHACEAVVHQDQADQVVACEEEACCQVHTGEKASLGLQGREADHWGTAEEVPSEVAAVDQTC